MRLATFNILHGRSQSDDRVDLDRFAGAIASLDADVLALQEVDRYQSRSSEVDLTALAAEAMGATEHRFVAALAGVPGATWMAAVGDEQPDSAAYGIALLSRCPVRAWHTVRLAPVPVRVPMMFSGSRRPELVRDEPRVAVAATVETPHGVITVANVHLTFVEWWNGRQLARVRDSLSGADRPFVLMGDLNMGPERAARISRMRPLVSGLTFPAGSPREQLDHVLLDGDLPPATGRVVELPLSDHRALVVDI
ncbi:endonuclease/exonuclease/phosphatase family protein [Nocardioides xinjiangensis]|uniref:endonuclease/exonuclease/phosphatase family protein n=1 Tax=Nocardioides xinjiangensis TaxID=2817376 RepID=UPI001B3060FE|nr:endonuclease/exonuclease/phosphatase family protein [Nocardioides sp. SYSU D00778]